MKKVILACLVGSVLATISAAAQGTLSLNTATGTKPRIQIDGVNVVPADNVWVEILVAGATGLSGLGAEPFQLTLTGANAGLFSKGTLTVSGKPGGSAVDVTIRAWDKDRGFSYDTASARASQTLLGFVLGGVVDSNGIASRPTSIVPAFTGFGCLGCPEPNPYALTGLAFSALAWLNQRVSSARSPATSE